MSQYKSFFINSSNDVTQCDELNVFLRSHVVIRTVENIISSGNNPGIQILIEYKDSNIVDNKKSRQRIDYRSELENDTEKQIFDRLREVRLNLAKEKNLKAAYLVCKDEHIFAMIKNPEISLEEIKNLPNSNNILLKDFANSLYQEYQKILIQVTEKSENTNDPNEIPF